MPVPCICAPNEAGAHPIELGVERFDDRTEYVRAGRTTPLARILSFRTPCDFGEADAVDRFGAVSCIGAINDIREVLRKGSFARPRAFAATEASAAAAISAAAEHARRVRHERQGARTRTVDPFGPPEPDSINPRPLPWVQHLGRTEYLATARLRRLWPGIPPGDVRVNFKLAQPQVQISSGLIEGQAVYEFVAVGRRRWSAGWRLKSGQGRRVATDAPNVQRTLDELLPAAPMRAVVRFWSRNA